MDAFWLLSGTRPVAFGPGAIQVSEMVAWCAIEEVEDRGAFVRIMRDLDSEWLKDWQAKNAPT